MSKGKGSNKPKTERVSSGNGVPGVARSTLNALRLERRRNPNPEWVLKSMAFKENIISRDKDRNPVAVALREKFLKEETKNTKACELYFHYYSACVVENDPKQTQRNLNNLWSQANHAASTDKVPHFQLSWNERMSKAKKTA